LARLVATLLLISLLLLASLLMLLAFLLMLLAFLRMLVRSCNVLFALLIAAKSSIANVISAVDVSWVQAVVVVSANACVHVVAGCATCYLFP
jgi:hypothetical protein